MRRVLRRIGTDHFLKPTGEDTDHYDNGKTFSGFTEALDFCVERDLKGVELVLLDEFGQEQACITLM